MPEIPKNIIYTVKGKVYNVHKHELSAVQGKRPICTGIGRTKPAVDGRCTAQFSYRFSPYVYCLSSCWDHFDNGNIVSEWKCQRFFGYREHCVLFALYILEEVEWSHNGLKPYTNGCTQTVQVRHPSTAGLG